MCKFFRILLVLSILAFAKNAYTQHYRTGLGLKAGYPSGITAKHFLNQKSAIEGVLSFGWGGVGVTGLYQLHNPFPDVREMTWYYGLGAHFATANASKKHPFDSASGSDVFLGIDGVIGAEYTFKDAPISLSLDILPILNIIESPGVWLQAGLSIRYTFK